MKWWQKFGFTLYAFFLGADEVVPRRTGRFILVGSWALSCIEDETVTGFTVGTKARLCETFSNFSI